MTVLLGVVIKESAVSLHNIDQMQRPWWWTAFLIVAGTAAVVVSFLISRAAHAALRTQQTEVLDGSGN
jgi:hypothetical protein